MGTVLPTEKQNDLHKGKHLKANSFLMKVLSNLNLRYFFGIPGGAIANLYAELVQNTEITPILCKHESNAGFMAYGYAKLADEGFAVCCSTSGPGAANMLSGVALAHGECTPVLALTGQISTKNYYKNAAQDSTRNRLDVMSIYANVSRFSETVNNAENLPAILRQAFAKMYYPKPGPAHLSLPFDQMGKTIQPRDFDFSLYRKQRRMADLENVESAVDLIFSAKQPVILAGNGINVSGAFEELRSFSEAMGIPVTTTPKGKGVFPENNELSFGVFGTGGNDDAIKYLLSPATDIIIAIGTSLSEEGTIGYADILGGKNKKLIHIDIDLCEVGRNYKPDIVIAGDAKLILAEMLRLLRKKHKVKRAKNRRVKKVEEIIKPGEMGNAVNPFYALKKIQSLLADNSIYFCDIGSIMTWATKYLKINMPQSFFLPYGYSTMGYTIGAAIGGKLAKPDRTVVGLVGNSAFLMNGVDVATAAKYQVPVKYIVFNDHKIGCVYWGMKAQFNTVICNLDDDLVDIEQFAKSLGADSVTINNDFELDSEKVKKMLSADYPKPIVMNLMIAKDAKPDILNRINTLSSANFENT